MACKDQGVNAPARLAWRGFAASPMLLHALLFLGLAPLVASTAYAYTSRGSAGAAGIVVAQADEKPETDEQVSSDEIKQYVAVYIAMQRNHSLSVEQAAASQGLTVAAFRELEQRIEDDQIARDQARQALVRGTQQTAPSHSGNSASPPTSHP
jgi:hypothetical protein